MYSFIECIAKELIMTTATADITIVAAPKEAAVQAPRRSWKAIVRRMFELWAEPYSHGPYQPL